MAKYFFLIEKEMSAEVQGFRVQWNLGSSNDWSEFECQIHLCADTDMRQRINAFATQDNLAVQDKVISDGYFRLHACFSSPGG